MWPLRHLLPCFDTLIDTLISSGVPGETVSARACMCGGNSLHAEFAGACLEILTPEGLYCRHSELHGATPLHLACARVAALLPDDATDIVALLCTPGSLHRCFGGPSAAPYHPEQVRTRRHRQCCRLYITLLYRSVLGHTPNEWFQTTYCV